VKVQFLQPLAVLLGAFGEPTAASVGRRWPSLLEASTDLPTSKRATRRTFGNAGAGVNMLSPSRPTDT
jgi:hypothetical protein